MSIRRFRSAVGAALIAVLAGTTLAAGPAAAAGSKTVATAKPVITKHENLTAASASGERVCDGVSFNNIYFGGETLCNYHIAYYRFPDGTLQLFVVGTDYGVWTRWRNPDGTLSPAGGWYDMGGQVKRGNPANLGDLAYNSPWVPPGAGWQPTLYVYGNEPGYWPWYRDRNENGEWGPWYSQY